VKKLVVFCFIAAFGGLFLMAGCAGNPRTAGNPQAAGNAGVYQLAAEERVILLYPEQKDRSPRMTLSFTLLDISGAGAKGRFFRDVLYQGAEPGQYREKILRDYEGEYFEMRAVADPDYPQENMNWFYTEIMEGDMLSSQGAVIRRSREYYTGGAHGMREREYFVLDFAEMERLGLEDVIKSGSEPALAEAVEAALRDFSNLTGETPLSQGYYFEDTVEPSKNFFLSSRGLGFHWDPYEIAPYVVGPVEILIPWDKIAEHLTPRALSLIEGRGPEL
jgi:hypothetical protein